MSKLDGMKDKITQIRASLTDKLDKIPFLKKVLEKKPEAAAKSSSSISLSGIYRDGGVATRLQVILFYVFLFSALASAGMMTKKIWSKIGSSHENDKLKKEYSHGLEALKHKAEEKAEMLSIGTMTVNAFAGEGRKAMVKIDVWAKVSDPAVAGMADKQDLIWHDRTLSALNEVFEKKVNLLTEEGKEFAKNSIKEALNKEIAHGKVEEIFFHNLVIQ